jgi:hypothetical protein
MVKGLTASSHEWVTNVDAAGVQHQTQPAFTDLSGTASAGQIPAALSATTSVNGTSIPAGGTLTQTIWSGSQALGTSSVGANTCATAINVAATGVASTDTLVVTPNTDISSQTGYSYSSVDGLKIYWWTTSGYVNLHVCNGTGTAITPGAVTVNLRVTR